MPRDTLTRDQIVRAAVELLDAEGIEGLSMRRLGAALGSAATSVYWHVKSKDDLVVLAGDEVWSEIGMPDPAVSGWRPAVAAMANDLYAAMSRHPWLVSATSGQLVNGPRMARFTDHAIAVFQAAGFTGLDVERAMNVVLTHVLGTALNDAAEAAWRARSRREGGDAQAWTEQTLAEAREIAAPYPRVVAHMEELLATDPESARRESFAFGLETILDGLAARLAVAAR